MKQKILNAETYFSEARRKKRARRRSLALVAAVCGAVVFAVGVLYLVFSTSLFRVSRITIEGNTLVSNDTVVELLRARVLGNSVLRHLLGGTNLLAWGQALSAQDLAFVPALSALTIKKDFFHRAITVVVSERAPFGVWCRIVPREGGGSNLAGGSGGKTTSSMAEAPPQSKECWWFDDRGVVFERAPQVQGSLTRVVDDYSGRPMGLGLNVLPDDLFPPLVSVFNVLTASGLGAGEVRLNDVGLQEVEVVLYQGPKILFGLRFPADNTLQVLERLKARPDFAKLSSVDFRVENRAYYK